jgi:hypothetical protein
VGEQNDSKFVFEWDGNQWRTNQGLLNPTSGNELIQPRGAYDSHRGVLVFGPTPERYSDWSFWDWDGEWWSINPVVYFTDPVVNELHGTVLGGFAFDASRRRSIWFGGVVGSVIHNKTALFDGNKWSLLTNGIPPAPRLDTVMVYDSDRQRMVMFGGNLNNTDRGATNDTWELAAVAAPLVSEHPASQYRKLGETATFTAKASGAGPLYYEWLRNGTNLYEGGIDSETLTINPVRAQDAGLFRVRILSPCGETWSRSAVLTLDPKLQIFSEMNTTTLVWAPDPKLVLEVADSVVKGPWTIIPNPPIPFNVAASGPGKFFRLRRLP